MSPLQQPEGHDVALQTHVPVVVLHVGTVPVHATQLSVIETPPGPHMELVSLAVGTHVLPLQQPTPPHESTLQTHVPPALHASPAGHEVPVQVQVPVVVSHVGVVAGQAWQAAPPAPHWAFVSPRSVTHPVPPQQPEHELPPHVHVPPEHVSPEEHPWQAAPPAPQ